MTKATALNNYTTKWFRPQMENLEESINTCIYDRRDEIEDHFKDGFKGLCSLILQEQETDCFPPISYISYSSIKINFLINRPLYLVEAFDDKGYFSNPICSLEYDPCWFTKLMNDFYEQAWEEGRKYAGQINKADVEKLMLIVLDKHLRTFRDFAQDIFLKAGLGGVPEYAHTKRSNLAIIVGSYRGGFKIIYREAEKQ
jgi:hypothetical protein